MDLFYCFSFPRCTHYFRFYFTVKTIQVIRSICKIIKDSMWTSSQFDVHIQNLWNEEKKTIHRVSVECFITLHADAKHNYCIQTCIIILHMNSFEIVCRFLLFKDQLSQKYRQIPTKLSSFLRKSCEHYMTYLFNSFQYDI